MLTEQDNRQANGQAPSSRSFAYEQGKTCRTCVHLDTDPKQDPCAGCRDFARWCGPDGVKGLDGGERG